MLEMLLELLQKIMFLSGYIGDGTIFPKQLTAEEEKKYLKLWQEGDQNAKNILIEHNLRLVAHIAKKYSNELNADDMISIGIIGLIKGINTFNPEKNPKLATYIARCIENEILMSLRTSKKLANEVSIDECIGTDKEGNALTFADILPADTGDIADELAIKLDIKKMYAIMSKVLKKNETDIIIWRYGLDGKGRRTQKEVAKRLGISRSYVSRIEKKALKKISDEFN